MDWNIQSRSHVCQSCGHRFTDRQTYFTLLLLRRTDLERLDVCPACWEAQHAQGAHDRKGFVSFWQGTYNAPPPAPPDPIQKDSAESLLRKLIERQDPRYLAVGFILAVMLERKRILKVHSQSFEAGQRLFVYEHARTGETFTIRDPDLHINELEAVQRDVARLLEHGLDPAPFEIPAASDGPPRAAQPDPAAPPKPVPEPAPANPDQPAES